MDEHIVENRVFLSSNRLSICTPNHSRELSHYYVERELGRGANGVAFLVKHELFERQEVLKIWTKLREHDRRDKIIQGVAEARKAHQAASDFVPRMFHAEIIDPIFYATMEFVPGSNLRQWLKTSPGLGKRWWMARLFMNAIRITMEAGVVHGDPHPGNVMISPDRKDPTRHGVKLLDFGTSLFSGELFSLRRHWACIDETMNELLAAFVSYKDAENHYAGHLAEGILPFYKPAYYDELLDWTRLEAHSVDGSIPLN